MSRIGILKMPSHQCTTKAEWSTDEFVSALEDEESGHDFPNLQTRQEVVNGNSSSLQTKEREAVASLLPNSMHTGQIIMLTKMLTASDLRFYEFESGTPVERWHSGPSGSS